MASGFGGENPYQSPPPAAYAAPELATAALADQLKKFRSQMHALGALWIFMGVLNLGLGVALLVLGPGRLAPANIQAEGPMLTFVLIAVLAVFGVAWLVVGVFTCLKAMPAVYVGLVLSYIALISSVINLSLCPILLFLLAVLQGHRVISWASQLRRAGVSLSAKPSG